MNDSTIFGFQWEDINDMQHKRYTRPTVKFTADADHAKQIMRDVERFQMPVYWEIVDAYNLTLPESYQRGDDGYFRHVEPS